MKQSNQRPKVTGSMAEFGSSESEESNSFVPQDVREYAKKEYWDRRYEEEDSFEWFKGYESFRHLVLESIKKTDKILMLGCGNSPLSADMYRDGFHHITNMDYSSTCIRHMRHKHADMAAMTWLEMDARQLTFPDGAFDVVLEKGTLDAFMVVEKSPWTVSEETAQFCDQVLQEVSRVLCPGGRFISISFAQPHFRTPLYADDKYGWSVRTDKFGDGFHYFFYTMERGGTLTQQQRDQAHSFFHPPEWDMTPVYHPDSDDFLRRIDTSVFSFQDS
ncbi:PREDICTED: endothelin-converting enzyme 2-like [Branchiostoma belcheri]|uniref:EEF1A lysine methyltransferase 4 n=1 Tax=Branchiostoma belcheri TaxID=7741 RepID=A0A6P4YFS4_BRABE|nr:PREDICTED: endothelin-converting enzyme 2-like [Branchiostoma belcheri]